MEGFQILDMEEESQQIKVKAKAKAKANCTNSGLQFNTQWQGSITVRQN
mgnify:CR=1 FL=1